MKLCNLDTAQALQELGYDGEYTMMYNTSNQLIEIDELAKSYCIPAPRLDDAAYWIRDKYHIFAMPILDPIRDSEKSYGYIVCEWIDEKWYCADYAVGYDYDSALEAAVTKAIEIIKNNEQYE